jgi:hypothetical protein
MGDVTNHPPNDQIDGNNIVPTKRLRCPGAVSLLSRLAAVGQYRSLRGQKSLFVVFMRHVRNTGTCEHRPHTGNPSIRNCINTQRRFSESEVLQITVLSGSPYPTLSLLRGLILRPSKNVCILARRERKFSSLICEQ